MSDRAELVIVGAGTLGGWASVFAAADGVGRVVVLERGLAGMGASSRAAGIVRAQGGTPATVALGRWSIDFYRAQAATYGTDSGFRELGYLILAITDDDERIGRERVAMQRSAGLADVRWLTAREAVSVIRPWRMMAIAAEAFAKATATSTHRGTFAPTRWRCRRVASSYASGPLLPGCGRTPPGGSSPSTPAPARSRPSACS